MVTGMCPPKNVKELVMDLLVKGLQIGGTCKQERFPCGSTGPPGNCVTLAEVLAHKRDEFPCNGDLVLVTLTALFPARSLWHDPVEIVCAPISIPLPPEDPSRQLYYKAQREGSGI